VRPEETISRRSIVLIGTGFLNGCAGGEGGRWQEQVIWREGSVGSPPLSRVSGFGRLPLSEDLDKGQIGFIDTSADGRHLIYGHAKLPGGEPGWVGAVEMETGVVKWTARPGLVRIDQVKWNPLSEYVWFSGYPRHDGSVFLLRSKIGCLQAIEGTGVCLREAAQDGAVVFGAGVMQCYFSKNGKIFTLVVGATNPQLVCEGEAVSVSPNGKTISVMDKAHSIRICDSNSGVLLQQIPGWFTDAGKWSPDGARLLLDGPIDVGVRIPWPFLRVYSMRERRLQGAVPNRIMVGTSKVFWYSWHDRKFKVLTVGALLNSTAHLCG
jgi:hypothetical protein